MSDKINKIIISSSKPEEINFIKNLLIKANLSTIGVEEHLENFLTLYFDGLIIGTVGLEIYGENALLRSLAVQKDYQNNGYAKMLCSEIIKKAHQKDYNKIYLLTETAPKFFESIGFEVVNRESANEEVKSSEQFRTICPSSAVCMRLKII